MAFRIIPENTIKRKYIPSFVKKEYFQDRYEKLSAKEKMILNFEKMIERIEWQKIKIQVIAVKLYSMGYYDERRILLKNKKIHLEEKLSDFKSKLNKMPL